jgi:hypothetical protein
MSTIQVKEISAPAGSDIKIASGKTLDLNSQGTVVLPTIPSSKMPTGSVLQVVSTLKTDRYETTSNGPTPITGMSVTITPASTSNTIWLISHLTMAVPTTGSGFSFAWQRGSTKVGVGSDGSRTPQGFSETYGSDGNTASTIAYQCMDSPNTTSAITYQLHFEKFNGGATLKVNTNSTMNGSSYDDIFTSGVTVMEIKG